MPLHSDVNLTSCHSGSDRVQSEVQWEGGKICRFTDEKATAFNLLVSRCWRDSGVKTVLEQTVRRRRVKDSKSVEVERVCKSTWSGFFTFSFL